MHFSTLTAFLFAGAGLVSGHGMINSVKINGKTYPGASGPGSDPSNSPVRAIASGDPVKDVKSNDIICGTSAKNAPISASVKAGDQIEIGWQGEDGGNWFHNVGPVQTYLAKCDSDCKDFTPSASTKWFKISALGRKSDNTWFQADMLNGSPLPVTIPSGLESGNYLMRHEIIALQIAMSVGGAEFYPNCVQMTVTGGSSSATSPSPTTTFPGAYSATDPGIKVDVYTPGPPYVMPGPAIANIAKSSSNDDSTDSSSPTSSTKYAPTASSAPANAAPTPTDVGSSAPVPTSTSTGNSTPKGSGTCKHKRSTGSKVIQKRALRAHAKRRLSAEAY